MKRIRHYFSLFLMFIVFFGIKVNAQSYEKKVEYNKIGSWNWDSIYSKSVNKNYSNNIIISSYVSKQRILSYDKDDIRARTVSNLPKYRYELILVSKSTRNNIPSKMQIYGARVFINGIEVTREQFPDGFTVVINTMPTPVYWYETSDEKIDIKISWESSNYFGN